MTAWISIISEGDADSKLKSALNMARTPHDTVDNVMKVHSLRPSTMKGHYLLYQAVLHDEANTLPPWLQEVIGSYVSILNNCDYSYANHWKNAKYLISDPHAQNKLRGPCKLATCRFQRQRTRTSYLCWKTTLFPAEIKKESISALRKLGFDDGKYSRPIKLFVILIMLIVAWMAWELQLLETKLGLRGIIFDLWVSGMGVRIDNKKVG